MNETSTLTERHSLLGVPTAKDWIVQFRRHRPPRTHRSRVEVLRAWIRRAGAGLRPRPRGRGAAASELSGFAVALLESHRTAGSDSRARLERAASEIDARLAELLAVPASQVGLGGLVVVMARCWIDYADDPGDRGSAAQYMRACRAYDLRVEVVGELWPDR